MLGPVLEELGQSYQGKIKFAKVNVDENPVTASEFGVLSIPTVIIFNKGLPLKTLVGVQPQETYQKILDKALQDPESIKSKVLDISSEIPIIFSTATCPWCVRLKTYLREHEVEYQDVNVGEDAEAAEQMINQSGQMGVPQMWYKGEVMIGFDQSKVDRLFNIL